MRKLVLAFALIALLAAFAFTRSMLYGPVVHEVIEWTGRVLLLVCIVGRCWCSLYIGGRKISELVRIGPYSLCRNPLYTFTFIGTAGAMAQSGSLVLTLVGTLACWIVFRVVVSKEERLLRSVYGQTYADYLAEAPRFWPKFSLWADVETVEARPKRIAYTLFDGLTFLLAIPLAELFEHLQSIGVIPVLLNLP